MSQFDFASKKAAALKYDPEMYGAPVIVASGMGHTAERITETAMKSGVPVYEDDSLATLLTQLKLGAEIPPELYQAIVEIYIYFLQFSVNKDGEMKKPETPVTPNLNAKKPSGQGTRTAQTTSQQAPQQPRQAAQPQSNIRDFNPEDLLPPLNNRW